MADSRKAALVMLFGDPSSDPRPNRIIETLNQHGFIVDIVSHEAKGDVNVRQQWEMKTTFLSRVLRKVFQLIRRPLSVFPGLTVLKNFVNNLTFGLAGFHRYLLNCNYSVIVVEDLFLLPLAFEIKGNAKIIFDAREYYPRQHEEDFLWRLFEKPERIRLCAKYLHLCDHIFTVSPGLQREYKKDFDIDTILYRSVPRYSMQMPRSTDRSHIKIVHHGVANPNRKLEKMIDVVKKLDSRFSFDMYLTGRSTEINSLRNHAADCDRIRILDPVPFESLNETLSSYDIGFYYLEPSGFNVTYNLPNKFFEFIQARLAIAIGPSPDMAMLTSQYDLGLVASEFTVASMADAINKLSADDIDQYKINAHKAAELLSYENEAKKIREIFGSK